MTETEGVIKFNLTFHEETLTGIDVDVLSGWRGVMKSLGMLGEEPDRYGGYGFGNVSLRVPEGFLVSGTQTGRLDEVGLGDYAFCESWNLAQNEVIARGAVKPSSESLSHAAVYDARSEANCALHAHCPDIWKFAAALDIPVTSPDVPYGTPEMAEEVRRVISDLDMPGLFVMGGHEDGVFSFGRTADEAGLLLVNALAEARLVSGK